MEVPYNSVMKADDGKAWWMEVHTSLDMLAGKVLEATICLQYLHRQ
jgi:hypothetical protein